ncbi:MAG TPA: lipopolysaccharide core heptose(I) kinase RfaP [Methylophilaceae bacterium]|nr:lipopolysaccharide core heptose(I) kinase RfaP [Methylophilaceae bacterium]
MGLACKSLVLPAEMRATFGDAAAFERIMALEGDVFRDVRGRRTLRFELQGRSYFAKLHYGVGWGEILKNLMTLRLPIVSAATEWRAIHRLNEIGIRTTPAVAYGCEGVSPAALRSFIITEDLGDIVSLETLCADWAQHPPEARFKRRLIVAVAELARKLHDNGLNHRDFYLCHLCLDQPLLRQGQIRLYLIDLHRVGIRARIRSGDRMKDIAALYFSAMDCGLGSRDILRFIRHYRPQGLRKSWLGERPFWRAVGVRAQALYDKFQRHRQRAKIQPG